VLAIRLKLALFFQNSIDPEDREDGRVGLLRKSLKMNSLRRFTPFSQ
jgi:hypothetical protein